MTIISIFLTSGMWDRNKKPTLTCLSSSCSNAFLFSLRRSSLTRSASSNSSSHFSLRLSTSSVSERGILTSYNLYQNVYVIPSISKYGIQYGTNLSSYQWACVNTSHEKLLFAVVRSRVGTILSHSADSNKYYGYVKLIYNMCSWELHVHVL